nr:MAG TPA: hypothetical protein [Bacteriophage sp.]
MKYRVGVLTFVKITKKHRYFKACKNVVNVY